MKALVLEAYNRLVYGDVPQPNIGPDEVLIQVKACGICGSDVHGIDGSTGRRIPPIIMGHEAAGVIQEVGVEVTAWRPGDRVTFDSTIYCGKCCFCRAGQVNLCDNRRVLGASPGHYRQNGALAHYVAVPQRILYRLPDAVSFTQAAMLEPLSVAFHAVSLPRIHLGKRVHHRTDVAGRRWDQHGRNTCNHSRNSTDVRSGRERPELPQRRDQHPAA
jgi:L-iditol 2-dehydrogenase